MNAKRSALLSRRLRNKQKGSNNRHKLNQKIARLHQRISDTRKDWHFKLSHQLVQDAGMIFIEDINFGSWQRGMLSKHSADAGFGQFVNILKWLCWKTDTYFAKVNKDGTSQTCPNCGTHTGNKTLDVRVHSCHECGYTTTRERRECAIVCEADWESFAFRAASQEIRNRGVSAHMRASPLLGSPQVEQLTCINAVGQTVFGRSTSGGFLQITPSENVCGLEATVRFVPSKPK